jgi:hypothetical protein
MTGRFNAPAASSSLKPRHDLMPESPYRNDSRPSGENCKLIGKNRLGAIFCAQRGLISRRMIRNT